MAFKLKKSIKLLPGVKLNLGKKGISSVSIGKRGATVNINNNGVQTTLGIPGTGISYKSKRKK